jgi:hypothetical protein
MSVDQIVKSISGISESLANYSKLPLDVEDSDLFKDCYKDFHSYLIAVGNYLVQTEPTFLYLKQKGPSLTFQNIKDKFDAPMLTIMTELSGNIAIEGFKICSVPKYIINISYFFILNKLKIIEIHTIE